MIKRSAIQARDKAGNFYIVGIAAFVGIFTTISCCLWFLSKVNF
jgi:hypothetical protein